MVVALPPSQLSPQGACVWEDTLSKATVQPTSCQPNGLFIMPESNALWSQTITADSSQFVEFPLNKK